MLDIQSSGEIMHIRLDRAPVNALDPSLVTALRQAVERAPHEGARGIILSGSQGMFSAGLDIPVLLTLDRDAMRAFWGEFFALCAALARAPIPIVAAVTGHSPAGGAVLALMCDYRVMAHGPFKIGLNEVQVGLIVPDCIQLAMRRIIGAYRAERLLVSGAMIDAEHAREIGLVDELVPVEQVSQRARRWLDDLLALPGAAMLATRSMARADLTQAFADTNALPVERFLDAWFEPATQAVLQALVARLKGQHAGPSPLTEGA